MADKPLRNAIDITNYFNKNITEISKEVGLFPCGFEALKLAQISTLNQQYSALGFHDVNEKYVITVIVPFKIKNQQDGMNYVHVDLIKRFLVFMCLFIYCKPIIKK